ncbi:MAG: ornithine carbamoyltransferase [Syntrophobacterales bacterium]|nr:ornithine carbamoyltransferase [Syntrophobacterales bacterium]
MARHFLTVWDLTEEEIWAIIERAQMLKKALREGTLVKTLHGKVLGLLFMKPSTRTRVSFEAGMYYLGGNCIFMTSKETQLSRQEPLSDTARVLSRYIDALVVRTYSHQEVEELARYSSIPVINGLTDLHHPCQVLGDLLTVWERKGSFNFPIAWVGDGNNVCHSWIEAAARLGLTLRIAAPEGFEPNPNIIAKARSEKEGGHGSIELFRDPLEAVRDVQVINTDVWTSMGQEGEEAKRKEVFRPYQVNERLLSYAHPSAIVLHCLPAHRGEEITDDVIEGPQSAVFDQAENRMFVQMALLEWLIISGLP